MQSNLKLQQLSIIIPIYNEEKNIKKLWVKIKRNIKIKKFEIIYVDDSSNDNTFNILKEISKKDKKVKFIIRKKFPRDLSQSCILGFKKSKYKNILVMDGDLQHDPKFIPKLINKYNSSTGDIIVGCRNFFQKKVFLIFLINVFLGYRTSDPMSGFFLFKKKILKKTKKKFFKKGYKILADLIYSNKENIEINDIQINFKKRIHGVSKINFRVLFLLIIFIFKKIKI